MLTAPWLSFGNRSIYLYHIVSILFIFDYLLRSSKEKKSWASLNHFFSSLKNKNWAIKFLYSWIVIFVLVTLLNFRMFNIKYIIIYVLFFCNAFIMIDILHSKELILFSLKVFSLVLITASVVALLEARTSFRLPFSLYLTRDFSKFNLEKLEYLMTYPTAFYFNPNDLAFLLVSFYGILLGRLRYSISKRGVFFALTLNLLALNLTKSRASLLGVAFITLIFICFEVDWKWVRLKFQEKKAIYLILLSSVIVLSHKVIFKLYDQIISIIKLIVKGDFMNSPYHSIRERWMLIVNSIEIIFSNPLGVGAGNGGILVAEKMNLEGASMHNYLLEVTMDFGLIFLIVFIAYNFLLIRKLISIRKTSVNLADKSVSLGLLMYKIGFLFTFIGPSSITYFIPYWYLEGIVLSYLIWYINKNEKRKTNESFNSSTLL